MTSRCCSAPAERRGATAAVLLPGMGAHRPGVLAGLAHLPQVRAVVQAVDRVDGSRHGVPRLLFDPAAPDQDQLLPGNRTGLHLAIYTASAAVAALLRDHYLPRPHSLLGHSVGEVTALTAAGCLTAADGARIILARDDALRAAALPPGGLLALSATAAEATGLVADTGLASLELACDNAPNQCVVSGTTGDLAVLAEVATGRGYGVKQLPVATAFHNGMLTEVAHSLRRRVRDIPFGLPAVPVFSPVLGRHYRGTAELRDAVVYHLVRPVRFRQALKTLHTAGVDAFVETGPRTILSAFVRATLPTARAFSALPRAATPDQIADSVATLAPTTSARGHFTCELEHDAGGVHAATSETRPGLSR